MSKMNKTAEITYTQKEVEGFLDATQRSGQDNEKRLKELSEKNRLPRQKGAKKAAEVKQQQKEWFYENIWSPAYDEGITLLENIIRYGVKKNLYTRKDGFLFFNGVKKSESTLKKWHTEFRKRKKAAN